MTFPDDSTLDRAFAASAIRPPSGATRQPQPVPCANGCLAKDGAPQPATVYHPDAPYDDARSICARCGLRIKDQLL